MAGDSFSVFASDFASGMQALTEGSLKEYSEKADKAIQKGGRSAKEYLVRNSPELSGEYAAGWRTKSENKGGSKAVVVYQAKKPGLAHLLEKGHGGPHPAGPHVHIADAYEFGMAIVEQELS